jgi:hypothetical protein
MMENDTPSTLIELRPRNRTGYGQPASSSNMNGASTSGWAKEDDRVHIEHEVQPTDSLYKIGLQYSVPVSFWGSFLNWNLSQNLSELIFVFRCLRSNAPTT